ncbi:hypothetical protein KUCAC02_029507, partial [Chaenocephalus aceratus]
WRSESVSWRAEEKVVKVGRKPGSLRGGAGDLSPAEGAGAGGAMAELDSVSDVMELLKRQEDLEAMIQAQSERFSALQKKKTQREKRLYANESTDLEDRKPAARVASLRSKPSDPKTPRPSRDIVRRVSSGTRTDRTSDLRYKTKKPASKPLLVLRPVLLPTVTPGDTPAQEEPWEVEQEEAPPPTPTVRTWRSRSSQSTGLLSSKASSPSSPQSSVSSTSPEEERCNGFKPPPAPKPRISSEERTVGLPSEKLAPPPDSLHQSEGLLLNSTSTSSSSSSRRNTFFPDPSPSPNENKELPPCPPQRQRKLEDLPEEEHGSTQEVTAERPIRMEGMLEIKLKQGGNKGLDHWEEVFAVLEEETLSLFNDRAAAAESGGRSPFLFAASSRDLLLLWVKKLQKLSRV